MSNDSYGAYRSRWVEGVLSFFAARWFRVSFGYLGIKYVVAFGPISNNCLTRNTVPVLLIRSEEYSKKPIGVLLRFRLEQAHDDRKTICPRTYRPILFTLVPMSRSGILII